MDELPEVALEAWNGVVSLYNRYQATNAEADLEELLKAIRDFVNQNAPNNLLADVREEIGLSIGELGMFLVQRYVGTRALSDLESGLELCEQAADIIPESNPEKI